MFNPKNKHLLPLIDELMASAIKETEDEGGCISCKKGCSHCCHLLVEITWEEAEELALWILNLPKAKKQLYIQRIHENALQFKNMIDATSLPEKFKRPLEGEEEYPDSLYDTYFYDHTLPCPLLENNLCSAYSNRPSPCRLHMVTSPVANCKANAQDGEDEIEIPASVEEVHEEVGAIMGRLHDDPRTGQLAVLVEEALKFNQVCSSTEV